MDEAKCKRLKDRYKWKVFVWRKYYYQRKTPGYKIKAVELWLAAHENGLKTPEKIANVFAEWVRKQQTAYIEKNPNFRGGTYVSARANWLKCHDEKKDVHVNDKQLLAACVRNWLDNYYQQHKSGNHFQQCYVDRRKKYNYFNAFRDYRIVLFVDFMVNKKNFSREKAMNLYVDFTERMHLKGKHNKSITLAAVKRAYYKMKKEISVYGDYVKNLK